MRLPRMTRPPSITPAATIVLARVIPDDGFEVFLVKRHGRSGFMAGAHVFPGGKVDADDALPEQDPFAICAIRETFEECGVLLARPESGLPLSTHDPIDAVTARVAAGEPFAFALHAVGLVPDVEALTPLAWWVTPEAEPRRYDTRFFFAVVPPLQRQSARADGVEVEDGVWLTPTQALQQAHEGTIRLAPPTLVTLEELAPLTLSLVRAKAWPSTPICPVLHNVDGELVLALPGDPLHPEQDGVWPERTRVVASGPGRFASAKVAKV
jgi:8-oxo-dGTP pyrophosphatase MutT (NUDIX family)